MPFSEETLTRLKADAAEITGRYPRARSALLPLLYLVQAEEGYVTDAGMAFCAEVLGITSTEVRGVASFYTMYYKRPVGKYHVQVCRTLSCALRGAGDVTACLEKRLGIKLGETTADGKFTLSEVECLASCGTAPMLQLNDDYVENLTVESTLALVERLEKDLEIPVAPSGKTRMASSSSNRRLQFSGVPMIWPQRARR